MKKLALKNCTLLVLAFVVLSTIFLSLFTFNNNISDAESQSYSKNNSSNLEVYLYNNVYTLKWNKIEKAKMYKLYLDNICIADNIKSTSFELTDYFIKSKIYNIQLSIIKDNEISTISINYKYTKPLTDACNIHLENNTLLWSSDNQNCTFEIYANNLYLSSTKNHYIDLPCILCGRNIDFKIITISNFDNSTLINNKTIKAASNFYSVYNLQICVNNTNYFVYWDCVSYQNYKYKLIHKQTNTNEPNPFKTVESNFIDITCDLIEDGEYTLILQPYNQFCDGNQQQLNFKLEKGVIVYA